VLTTSLFCRQVTEALNAGDLRPPHVPFELLQQLAQTPAALADMRTTLTSTGELDVSSTPASQLYWTARLSAVAAQQEGAAASSSEGTEQLQGVHLADSRCCRARLPMIHALAINAPATDAYGLYAACQPTVLWSIYM